MRPNMARYSVSALAGKFGGDCCKVRAVLRAYTLNTYSWTSGVRLLGGQGPSYCAPKEKSLNTCCPNVLPAIPAFGGSCLVPGAMLYMPQCVKDAVTSNMVTTKLCVSSGAFVQESSGELFPPPVTNGQ